MRTYTATITIDAPPERVWAVLTDASAWPEWDPTCERIEGTIAAGAKLKAFSKLSPDRAFPVKVSHFIPNQRMVWSGGLPLGLFKGERTFTLTPAGDGTQFAIREVFSGPLLKLIGGSIPDMTEPFRRHAAGLKQRAESA